MCSGLFSTEKDIHKSTFSDELLDKWHKDGLTFMIQLFPRGRYITKAAQYVSLALLRNRRKTAPKRLSSLPLMSGAKLQRLDSQPSSKEMILLGMSLGRILQVCRVMWSAS